MKTIEWIQLSTIKSTTSWSCRKQANMRSKANCNGVLKRLNLHIRHWGLEHKTVQQCFRQCPYLLYYPLRWTISIYVNIICELCTAFFKRDDHYRLKATPAQQIKKYRRMCSGGFGSKLTPVTTIFFAFIYFFTYFWVGPFSKNYFEGPVAKTAFCHCLCPAFGRSTQLKGW